MSFLKNFRIFNGKKKILVTSYNYSACFVWWVNNSKSRFGCGTFHIYDILVRTILGISAFYHDSAASILIDGKIIAAAQEERFTRVKHDSNYPYNAVEFVLNYANLKLSQVDQIVFFEKPFLKFERLPKHTLLLHQKVLNHSVKQCQFGLKISYFKKNY